METGTASEMTRRLRRKRLRYQLIIAGIVVPICIGAVMAIWHVHQVRKLRETIHYYGGSALPSGRIVFLGRAYRTLPDWIPEPMTEWVFHYFSTVNGVYLTGNHDVPASDLRPIKHLCGPYDAMFLFSNLSDEHCAALKGCDAKSLEIGAPQMTHKGLRHLSKIKSLKGLKLKDVHFDVEMAQALGLFTKLKHLDLSEVEISPEVFAHIPATLSIQELGLPPSIGEESIPNLICFSELEYIKFKGSPIREAGFEMILNELPKLRIFSINQSTELSKSFLYKIRKRWGVAVFGDLKEW